MFRGEQGFPEDQMDQWMVGETIRHHHLEILANHPPVTRLKDVVLEFVMNFEPYWKRVWIREKYCNITPLVGAEALRCSPYHGDDNQLVKD